MIVSFHAPIVTGQSSTDETCRTTAGQPTHTSGHFELASSASRSPGRRPVRLPVRRRCRARPTAMLASKLADLQWVAVGFARRASSGRRQPISSRTSSTVSTSRAPSFIRPWHPRWQPDSDAARHRQHVPALFLRRPGRDQRPALLGGLDDHHRPRRPLMMRFRSGKCARQRAASRREFLTSAPARSTAPRKLACSRRIDHVKPAPEDRDGPARRRRARRDAPRRRCPAPGRSPRRARPRRDHAPAYGRRQVRPAWRPASPTTPTHGVGEHLHVAAAPTARAADPRICRSSGG